MRIDRKKKKLTHWILIVYSIVLIVSMAIVLFVNDHPKLSAVENDLFSVEDELLSGNYNEIDEQYKTGEYHFDYGQDTLEITAQYPENALFIVEKKQELDEKVDVTIFGPYAQINKYDVSDQIQTFKAELKSNELSLSAAVDDILDANIITTNFTSRQFLEQNNFFDQDFAYTVPIIYVQLPSNIKITQGPEINVRTVSQ